ncbi:dihydrolipoyl dehydrogenase [Haladaptatus halobius]|uniref:dihydrolipoyl dehydrogenase n=1 Tax=Haladaptatus halobius TaxID=2884875 RepID=UPI001D0A4236|nr:dihydrolipoyl dehydrogenase [Haladaptatus halobius]
MSAHHVPDETDVVIVGAGPGGYVAAIRAAQLDMDVTLVEKGAVGGMCLNDGCIPSKALISATDTAHAARHAEERGIDADLTIDLQRMVNWKDSVVDRLTGGVEKLCEQAGVTLIEGRATFADDTTVEITSKDEETTGRLTFEQAIIATGSRPTELPGFEFDGERVLDARDALTLETVPDSLLVIGAGYIGMELATVFTKLGADVTVVEPLDSVLPRYEDDVSDVVRTRGEDLGIEFHVGEAPAEWREHDSDGIIVETEDEDGEQTEFDTSKVVVAAGRKPVTDTLNLAAVGLEPNEDGFVETDNHTRTAVKHVFAVGDVAGKPLLAHKGMMEGEVAAEVIAGEPAALDYQVVPEVMFTDPEIGTVGMTETEAVDAGYSTTVGTMPMQASGRALTLNDDEGFVRVVAEAEEGYLLGAQIVASEASELIAEFGLAIELGATVEDVAATIHTHPTLAEAAKEAAANTRDRAIHTRNE